MRKLFSLAVCTMFFFCSHAHTYDKFDIQICEAHANESGKVNCYQELDPHKCNSGSSSFRLRCYRDQIVNLPKNDTSSSEGALYSVIKDDSKRNIKRSVDILLEHKISQQELTRIAYKIKESSPTTYERTFIGYFLEGSDRNDGYWATTHFNPGLKVSIMGLSLEAENRLSSQVKSDASKNTIGVWLDDRSYIGAKMKIFNDNGKVMLESSYSDGSSGVKEMVSKKMSRGLRIEDKLGNDFGEYFLITSKGELEFWSKNGNYYTAKQLQYNK